MEMIIKVTSICVYILVFRIEWKCHVLIKNKESSIKIKECSFKEGYNIELMHECITYISFITIIREELRFIFPKSNNF